MIKSKFLTQTVLALSASMLLQTSVQAQEYDNRANVYGGAVHQFIDSDLNQDNAFGWLFGAELPVATRWGLSLEHWLIDSDNETGPGDAELRFIRVGGNFHLPMTNDWQPYLTAGVGKYRLDESLSVPGVDEAALDVGIGVKRFFGENFFLRSDVKLIRVQDIHSWDQTVNLTFGYAFGSRSRTAAPVAAAPVAAAVDPDSDGDGVADSRDRCANTPRNLAVDANGCPILDRSQERQDLLVTFDFDQSLVKPEFYDEIETFAEFLRTYSNVNAVIEGHTDSDGTEAYNQGLSERRARAVMNRLINTHGIAASRLSAVGYGESRPVVENSSPANKQRNRRIESEVSVQIEVQRQR